MGTKYTTQTQTGFDASPPPDDGSVQASNKVRWSFVKDKIGTPVLNLAQAINTALVTFTNFGSRAVTSTDSVAAADHMKTIECSGTFTESLPDATATAAGFITTIKNTGTGIITVALVTGTDTLDGVVNGTFTLYAQASATFKTNAGATGYYTQGFSFPPVTYNNSLAADVALNNTSNYFNGPVLANATGNIKLLVTGGVTITDSGGGAAACYAKLTDGTTVIDSGVVQVPSGGGNPCFISLSGVIASPAGNLRISVRDVAATTGSILFNASLNSKDSTLSAVRIG